MYTTPFCKKKNQTYFLLCLYNYVPQWPTTGTGHKNQISFFLLLAQENQNVNLKLLPSQQQKCFYTQRKINANFTKIPKEEDRQAAPLYRKKMCHCIPCLCKENMRFMRLFHIPASYCKMIHTGFKKSLPCNQISGLQALPTV